MEPSASNERSFSSESWFTPSTSSGWPSNLRFISDVISITLSASSMVLLQKSRMTIFPEKSESFSGRLAESIPLRSGATRPLVR